MKSNYCRKLAVRDEYKTTDHSILDRVISTLFVMFKSFWNSVSQA